MSFLTIGQYFDKLYSLLFLLLIVPLLIFTALYFFVTGPLPEPPLEYTLVLSAVVTLDWLMAMIIFNKKIKSARNGQGLAVKLDKYFKITIVRYGLLSSASLMLAGGWVLSRSDVFTGMYLSGLVLAGVLWPTPGKVCGDLSLRGDERVMVYYKKDSF